MLQKKVVAALKLLDQIVEVLDSEVYSKRLGSLRSNSIGHQLWCLAGARESYLAAVAKDANFQWICSFKADVNSKSHIDTYLRDCSEKLVSALEGMKDLSSNQQSLLLDLLAHEYQHQGQLIRYIYGNKLQMPPAWREFWHLEQ
jgi:hypothetical protein